MREGVRKGREEGRGRGGICLRGVREGGKQVDRLTADINSKPPPPAHGETEPHRERGGIAHVGFTMLLIVLCAFLAKRPRREASPPSPRKSIAPKQL